MSCCYFSTWRLNELCRNTRQCCFAVVEINQFCGTLGKKSMWILSLPLRSHTHAHRVYTTLQRYPTIKSTTMLLTVHLQYSSLQLDLWSIETSLHRQSERLRPCMEEFMLRFDDGQIYKSRVQYSREGDGGGTL